MRVVDLLISFPDVIVAIFLIALFGPGYGTLIVALTVVGWTPFAGWRAGLPSRSTPNPISARPRFWAVAPLHHLPPHHSQRDPADRGRCLPALRPQADHGRRPVLPRARRAAAACRLGAMMASSQPYLERAPLLVICPGLAIFLTALSVTWIGHGLEMKRKSKGREHDRGGSPAVAGASGPSRAAADCASEAAAARDLRPAGLDRATVRNRSSMGSISRSAAARSSRLSGSPARARA